MSQFDSMKQFWDDASKDPDLRYKYIADEWATTEEFIDVIESANDKWHTVLEIGCGIGRLLVPLADAHKQCQFYGIDISHEMMKLAPRRKNIKYNGHDEQLDMVYSMLVFQHIPHETKLMYVEWAHRLLATGGVLLLQYVIGTENEPYSYQTNPDTMVDVLESVGFTVTMHEQKMHEQWMFIRGVK